MDRTTVVISQMASGVRARRALPPVIGMGSPLAAVALNEGTARRVESIEDKLNTLVRAVSNLAQSVEKGFSTLEKTQTDMQRDITRIFKTLDAHDKKLTDISNMGHQNQKMSADLTELLMASKVEAYLEVQLVGSREFKDVFCGVEQLYRLVGLAAAAEDQSVLVAGAYAVAKYVINEKTVASVMTEVSSLVELHMTTDSEGNTVEPTADGKVALVHSRELRALTVRLLAMKEARPASGEELGEWLVSAHTVVDTIFGICKEMDRKSLFRRLEPLCKTLELSAKDYRDALPASKRSTPVSTGGSTMANMFSPPSSLASSLSPGEGAPPVSVMGSPAIAGSGADSPAATSVSCTPAGAAPTPMQAPVEAATSQSPAKSPSEALVSPGPGVPMPLRSSGSVSPPGVPPGDTRRLSEGGESPGQSCGRSSLSGTHDQQRLPVSESPALDGELYEAGSRPSPPVLDTAAPQPAPAVEHAGAVSPAGSDRHDGKASVLAIDAGDAIVPCAPAAGSTWREEGADAGTAPTLSSAAGATTPTDASAPSGAVVTDPAPSPAVLDDRSRSVAGSLVLPDSHSVGQGALALVVDAAGKPSTLSGGNVDDASPAGLPSHSGVLCNLAVRHAQVGMLMPVLLQIAGGPAGGKELQSIFEVDSLGYDARCSTLHLLEVKCHYNAAAYEQLGLAVSVLRNIARPLEQLEPFWIQCHFAFLRSDSTPSVLNLQNAAREFAKKNKCELTTHVFSPEGGERHITRSPKLDTRFSPELAAVCPLPIPSWPAEDPDVAKSPVDDGGPA